MTYIISLKRYDKHLALTPRGWPSGQSLGLRGLLAPKVLGSKPPRCYQSYALTLIALSPSGLWDWTQD